MGEASFLASLSAGDLAAGERLLQVGHPVILHPAAAEVQRGELLEILQLLQARIRHLGAAEVHPDHRLARQLVVARDLAAEVLNRRRSLACASIFASSSGAMT